MIDTCVASSSRCISHAVSHSGRKKSQLVSDHSLRRTTTEAYRAAWRAGSAKATSLRSSARSWTRCSATSRGCASSRRCLQSTRGACNSSHTRSMRNQTPPTGATSPTRRKPARRLRRGRRRPRRRRRRTRNPVRMRSAAPRSVQRRARPRSSSARRKRCGTSAQWCTCRRRAAGWSGRAWRGMKSRSGQWRRSC